MRRVTHLLGLVVLAVVTLFADSAFAETIKLATLAPEGSPWHESIREMAVAWERASNGRIRVRIYPSGIAGDETATIRKMRVGQLQAGAISGGGLADIAADVRALQMPMMFESEAEYQYVAERIRPKLESALEAKGFKVLAWGDIGWLYFFTTKPVVGPEDLKALKLFTWSAEAGYVDAWKAAGFNPVPLDSTELLVALQTGLIEAIVVPPAAALGFQWFGIANHMTDLKWVRLVGAIVIAGEAWDALPDDLKPALLDAAEAAGAGLDRGVEQLAEEAIAAMQRHGLVVHPVPPAAVGEWATTTRKSYPLVVGRMVQADLVNEVERLRDEYRKLHAGQ